MLAIILKNWFQRNRIGRGWFLLAFALTFGIIVVALSRLTIYLLDVFVFNDPPEPIRPVSLAIPLITLCGFGLWIARRNWPR